MAIEKAYKNLNFLNSPAARTIRMLCEYEEPRQRFRTFGVENTIVMFGSARCRSQETADKELALAEKAADGRPRGPRLDKARKGTRLARYECARDLHDLAIWGVQRGQTFLSARGGGPGIMEGESRRVGRWKGSPVARHLARVRGRSTRTRPPTSASGSTTSLRKYWFVIRRAMVRFRRLRTMDELFEL
jgi:predicted Rossmann-fold nucleotide-binding protein